MSLGKRKLELESLRKKSKKLELLINSSMREISLALKVAESSHKESKHRNVFFGSWRMEVKKVEKTLNRVLDLLEGSMVDAVAALDESELVIQQREDW